MQKWCGFRFQFFEYFLDRGIFEQLPRFGLADDASGFNVSRMMRAADQAGPAGFGRAIGETGRLVRENHTEQSSPQRGLRGVAARIRAGVGNLYARFDARILKRWAAAVEQLF